MDRISQLTAAQTIIASIEDLLLAERRAIATMDVQTVTRLSTEKGVLRDRLRIAYENLATLGGHSDGPDVALLVGHVRTANRRMLASAMANCNLFDDVLGAISEAMGLQTETGTYDRHAQKRVCVLASEGKRA